MAFDIYDFLPSWVDVAWTMAIASGLGLFFRERLGRLIDTRVQHRYNSKLEELKDELSRNAKEIDTLRTSVLSLRAQRQAGVEKRRLEGIDQLWSAVKIFQAKKGTATMMSLVKFENAAKEAETNLELREAFEMIGGGKVGPNFLPQHQAHEARPYVSPLAWALFNAYQSAISFLLLQLMIIQYGTGTNVIKGSDDIVAMLIEAVPEWKPSLEKFGTGAFPYVLDELEKRILNELRRMIAGEDDDAEHAAQAVRIIAKVEEINRNERQALAKQSLGNKADVDHVVGSRDEEAAG